MIDFNVIAYVMLGLSVSASAVQIGVWLLNANPRSIIAAGRWSLAGLAALAPLALLWLMLSGRSTLAMMFAAFILPVFVQGAHRWRGLLRPLGLMRSGVTAAPPDLGAGLGRGGRAAPPTLMDADLVQQSVAVLKAYLEQTGRHGEFEPIDMRFGRGPVYGSGNGSGRGHMSTEEAIETLGLEPTANPHEVREAHRRLQQRLDPGLGGTPYLNMKIDAARDVLLGQ